MFDNTDDDTFHGAISEEPDLIDTLSDQELARFKSIDDRKKSTAKAIPRDAPMVFTPEERAELDRINANLGPSLKEKLLGSYVSYASGSPLFNTVADAAGSLGVGGGFNRLKQSAAQATEQFSPKIPKSVPLIGGAPVLPMLGTTVATSPIGAGASALGRIGLTGGVGGVMAADRGGDAVDIAGGTLSGFAAGGAGELGGKLVNAAASRLIKPRQPVLPEINPALPAQESQELTRNAFRKIAAQEGMSEVDVNRILASNPEFAEKVIIEYNRGRSQGILGPWLENIRTSKIANRNIENQELAKQALNEATQEFPPLLPSDKLKGSLEATEESLLKSGGGEDRVGVIRKLLNDISKARSMDPNAAKVAATARARNPMQSMPEAPPPSIQRPGDVGGAVMKRPVPEGFGPEDATPQQIDSWLQSQGDVVAGQSTPLAPNPIVRDAVVGSQSTMGRNVSRAVESPDFLTPVKVPQEQIPVAGVTGTPSQSLPISDPTTMGRIRAAQAQAKPLMLPRDSTPSGGSLPEVQGWLDRPGQILSEGATQSAKAGGSIAVEQPYKDAANALYRGLEDISSPEAVAAYRNAVDRAKAARMAGEASQKAALGSTPVKEGGSARMTAARTALSPLTDRWNILSQNYYADKLLMTPNISPQTRQILEWVRQGSNAGAQASRLYIAAQKNPEILGAIQRDGKENE
jgi:hypothetical protein